MQFLVWKVLKDVSQLLEGRSWNDSPSNTVFFPKLQPPGTGSSRVVSRKFSMDDWGQIGKSIVVYTQSSKSSICEKFSILFTQSTWPCILKSDDKMAPVLFLDHHLLNRSGAPEYRLAYLCDDCRNTAVYLKPAKSLEMLSFHLYSSFLLGNRLNFRLSMMQ
ncbi:uncharacterized protein LOC134143140 isoform X2 [Rhea pennata]|uniref:uncharacterized protein LOC134143140 isoform X2 n=1 Tax=Rhea pennata TaxID=8795 RepID=UPI002E26D4BC